MPLSSKLCFVGVDYARALRSDADAGKRSFQNKCVTKLELGHEGRMVQAAASRVHRAIIGNSPSRSMRRSS